MKKHIEPEKDAALQPARNFCSDPQVIAEARQVLAGGYTSPGRLLVNVIMTVLVCETAADLVITALHLPPPLDTVVDSVALALLLIPIYYHMIAKPYLLQLHQSLDMGKALLQSNEQACQMAITDELTGLYNRRGFFELARHQFNVSKRYGKPLALLFCDLDYLKRINDELGHDAGDLALQDAARAISGGLRSSDVAARVGGDEFAVILPQSDDKAARTIAARIEAALAALNQTREPKLSLSIGLRELDAQAMRSIDDLLALADADMYRAKSEKKAAERKSRGEETR